MQSEIKRREKPARQPVISEANRNPKGINAEFVDSVDHRPGPELHAEKLTAVGSQTRNKHRRIP